MKTAASLSLLASLIAGCAGAPKHAGPYKPVPKSESSAEETPAQPQAEQPKTEQPGGIIETPPAGRASGTYGPAPTQVVPLTVVLGPGMARGFAYAGALQALKQEGIPIGMIAATGEGALFGALYTTSATDNEFDWALQKIKEDVFFESSLSLSKLFGGQANGKYLRGQLDRLFDKKSFGSARIPLRVGIYSELANEFELVGKGRIAGILRVALSERGLYEAGDWFGAPSWDASQSVPFPVEQARATVNAPVLAIDVLDPDAGEEADGEARTRYLQNMQRAIRAGKSALGEADLVLRPELKGIGYFDFSKRSDAVFAGRRAVEEHVAEIRELTGMRPKEVSQ